MNKWSEQFNIPYPECKSTGQCCRCASPSTPAINLLQKAADNNDFARDFFSIFIPYESIEDAKKVNSGIVERSLKSCENSENKVSKENVVFFHCRYISEDNKCLIYEDRPQLCRDYPDSPFLIFAPGCAYEDWSKQCKTRYNELKNELEKLKEYKKELECLKYQQKVINLLQLIQKINNKDYNLMLFLPSLSLISPGKSWFKFY